MGWVEVKREDEREVEKREEERRGDVGMCVIV
jgi:hypothetical protein